ncbi:MAG: hypothetical protein WC895_02545 [Candidatus Shapirobacteria bacterium]|jgi:Tfp pilus assembly protein PilX
MENKLIKKNKSFRGQSGQVVLIVMLVSALVLTLGLSASRQATVETKIDTDQELLKKAFNMAESGVDYYLGTGSTQYTFDVGTSSLANLNITNIGGGSSLVSDGIAVEGSTEVFWLVGHDNTTNDGLSTSIYYSGTTIDICSPTGDGNFKIDYFYKNGINFNVSRSYQTTSNRCIRNFAVGGGNIPILVAVTPVGFQTKIILTGPVPFPVQGEEISSTGQVGSVNTVVRVINKYQVPTFMLEAITAGGDVLSR